MIRRPLLLAALGLAALAPSAAAAEHVPGEVVVRYAPDAAPPGTAHASAVVAPRTRVVRTRPGQTVGARAAELRRRPGVLSATPNLIARAAYIPNDPGRAGVPGGWQQLQWNFVGPFGVNAPAAWDHTGEAGRLGGAGVVVAVLDTGVAYADHRRHGPLARPAREPLRGRPRLRRRRRQARRRERPRDARRLHDRRDDRQRRRRHRPGLRRADHAGAGARPLGRGRQRGDLEGDPVRGAQGRGHHQPVVRVRRRRHRRADPRHPRRAALRARARASSSSARQRQRRATRSVAYPARAASVFSVGATTEHGCLADYSNAGAHARPRRPGRRAGRRASPATRTAAQPTRWAAASSR